MLAATALVDLYRQPAQRVVSGYEWIWLVLILSLLGPNLYLLVGRKTPSSVAPSETPNHSQDTQCNSGHREALPSPVPPLLTFNAAIEAAVLTKIFGQKRVLGSWAAWPTCRDVCPYPRTAAGKRLDCDIRVIRPSPFRRVQMSLSRRERGLLKEIGRQLFEDDPKFAERLGQPPRRASDGWILAGGVLFTLCGFAILMLGAVLASTALGAVGFIAMAAGGSLALRRIGPPQLRWVKWLPRPGMRHNTPVE
ncbi:DUF3040 domain-containing protein [Pseudarthrobacter sp. RMG13]|uniref:DUF3040 domain-containing protein n=1 Tax=Pseudarthrobacter humi TaxID=2952523 RepID=A0ABT1LNS5_9MICC|nr:DUF3040 domain-containing protein [Pseudarthrobacter humi]MCP8999368.1 DUF3040 domain-containing protein [Pseudarthrobacter humi]